MRTFPTGVTTALQAREVIERKLYWFTVRDRDTDLPVNVGIWNDEGSITVDVQDALTGSTVARTFYGGGAVLKDPEVPQTSDLMVRESELVLSPIHPVVAQLIRGYDPKYAP